MKDVKDKVAVITGAASGIGRGMAESFVEAGMKVVLSDVDRHALEVTAKMLKDAGADVHAVVTDVSKPEQVEALAKETLKKYGAVHVLCNNAGIGAGGHPSWTSTLDDWKWILGVNLMGVIHGIRTFMPIMIKQDTEAHIVNTASIAGLVLSEGNVPYAATKHAVVAISESMCIELQRGGFRPRMSVLCPGFVNTNIIDSNRNRPADKGDASPIATGPIAEVVRQWLQDQIKEGINPRYVGEMVLAAIREERFYILTHPEMNELIEKRMKNILEGENPSPSPLPESLLKRFAALSGKGN